MRLELRRRGSVYYWTSFWTKKNLLNSAGLTKAHGARYAPHACALERGSRPASCCRDTVNNMELCLASPELQNDASRCRCIRLRHQCFPQLCIATPEPADCDVNTHNSVPKMANSNLRTSKISLPYPPTNKRYNVVRRPMLHSSSAVPAREYKKRWKLQSQHSSNLLFKSKQVTQSRQKHSLTVHTNQTVQLILTWQRRTAWWRHIARAAIAKLRATSRT